MTTTQYLIIFALSATAVVTFARGYLKGYLDANHPSVEAEAELEGILAHSLAFTLAEGERQ